MHVLVLMFACSFRWHRETPSWRATCSHLPRESGGQIRIQVGNSAPNDLGPGMGGEIMDGGRLLF